MEITLGGEGGGRRGDRITHTIRGCQLGVKTAPTVTCTSHWFRFTSLILYYQIRRDVIKGGASQWWSKGGVIPRALVRTRKNIPLAPGQACGWPCRCCFLCDRKTSLSWGWGWGRRMNVNENLGAELDRARAVNQPLPLLFKQSASLLQQPRIPSGFLRPYRTEGEFYWGYFALNLEAAVNKEDWGLQFVQGHRNFGQKRQMQQKNAMWGCSVEAAEKCSTVAGRWSILASDGSVNLACRKAILFCTFSGVSNQCPENRNQCPSIPNTTCKKASKTNTFSYSRTISSGTHISSLQYILGILQFPMVGMN